MNGTPCLSLWERCLSEAKAERVYQGAVPSQSPSVTAPPKGEPRGCLRSLFFDRLFIRVFNKTLKSVLLGRRIAASGHCR